MAHDNGVQDSQQLEVKDDGTTLPLAGCQPGAETPSDLAKQLSVRSSGRDRTAVNYNRLASGTQEEPPMFDPTPTQKNQGNIKYQKTGIQVNAKHLKKCQDLLKAIRSSQQWIVVVQAVSVTENRDVLQKQLEFIDTIEKNLVDLKYAKCSDLIGEIQSFLMTLFGLTSGEGNEHARDKVSQLLDYSTRSIDATSLAQKVLYQAPDKT